MFQRELPEFDLLDGTRKGARQLGQWRLCRDRQGVRKNSAGGSSTGPDLSVPPPQFAGAVNNVAACDEPYSGHDLANVSINVFCLMVHPFSASSWVIGCPAS